MQAALVVAALLGLGCASRSPYKQRVLQVHADASKGSKAFAQNFAAGVEAETLEDLRKKLLEKPGAPSFESGGPVCIRATWGGDIIESSIFFYLIEKDSRILISDFVSQVADTFDLWGHRVDRVTKVDEEARCREANLPKSK